MCGIAGYWNINSDSSKSAMALKKMVRLLEHRGPDGEGFWYDNKLGIGLGHRRLSIIDLSEYGSQPMLSKTRDSVITYNGEVYNYQQIRKELEAKGIKFRGHSDTEIIQEAIENWGLKDAVTKFIGMFAFALWDKKNRQLSIARDRLGIKPLYYAWINGNFVFASELKSIKAFPGFEGEIDRTSLGCLLKNGYIGAPLSMYKSIKKLKPGKILTIKFDSHGSSRELEDAFWSPSEVIEKGMDNTYSGTATEAINELENILIDSIGLRMLSDVPLGAFLSGGIDSSLVVALMQMQSDKPIKTFTVGFHEKGYNEAKHAEAVAKHIGTEHHQIYITHNEAMATIPVLTETFDEPFSDPSQIPTYLVSKMARGHVKVCLSGDGGDELFCGYNRYLKIRRIWNAMSLFPARARLPLSKIIQAGNHKLLQNEKLCSIAEIMGIVGKKELYALLFSQWKNIKEIVINCEGENSNHSEHPLGENNSSLDEYMMAEDLVKYLPDDILVKMDRASMGVGLEARVPILDHRVVEFSWRLPQRMKLYKGEGKWILKQVLCKHVPKSLIERPKMGFGVPIGEWLRGPLRDWAESLLDAERLKQDGFFHPDPVRKKWDEHIRGTRNWQFLLWNVIMFQAWLYNNN